MIYSTYIYYITQDVYLLQHLKAAQSGLHDASKI